MLNVSDVYRAWVAWSDLATLPFMVMHRMTIDSVCTLAEVHARHMLEQALKDLNGRFER